MQRSSFRQAWAIAASLSLLAGCASPVVPPTGDPAAQPEVPAQGATGAAPAEAGPGAGPIAAPAAAPAPVVFEGVATYRGEPLAGYTVGVYHLGTDAAVGQTPGPDGLAVASRTATTDAQGRYRVEVAGLRPGFDVRVMVSSPQETGSLFATLAAPEAGAPALTASEGAIDEQSTLASLLTEGASRLLWASVATGAVGYRLAQAAPLTPAQQAVMTATRAFKATVAPLSRPATPGERYAWSVSILDAANQLKAWQKALAAGQADREGETLKVNAKVSALVSNIGIQAALTKAAIALVTQLPHSAIGPVGVKRAPLALLGTPLALEMGASGLPGAVVNTSTNRTLDLAALNASAGTALDASFAARASSGGSSEPALALSAISQAKASTGTWLTLTGTRFSTTLADNVVTINGATATPRKATATSLEVAVPAEAALGAGTVAVTVRGVAAPETVAFTKVARGTVLQTLDVGGQLPIGVAVDSTGDVYVAMLDQHVVKRYRSGALTATYQTGQDTALLVIDRFDTVWVTTGAGLKRIVKGVVSDTGLTGVGAMSLDGDGRLWLARKNTDLVTRLTLAAEGAYTASDFTLPDAANWGAIAASGSTVWVGARDNNAIVPVTTEGVVGTPVSMGVGTTSMAFDATGKLWVSGYPTGEYWDPTTLRQVGGNPPAVVGTEPIQVFVEGFVVAPDGAMWGTMRYQNYLTRFNADGTTSNDHVQLNQPIGLTKDAAGNLWVGSIEAGFVRQIAP